MKAGGDRLLVFVSCLLSQHSLFSLFPPAAGVSGAQMQRETEGIRMEDRAMLGGEKSRKYEQERKYGLCEGRWTFPKRRKSQFQGDCSVSGRPKNTEWANVQECFMHLLIGSLGLGLDSKSQLRGEIGCTVRESHMEMHGRL